MTVKNSLSLFKEDWIDELGVTSFVLDPPVGDDADVVAVLQQGM